MDKSQIIKRLAERVLVLDGATGTQLQLRGMPEGVCPELWCLENPGPITAIHQAYQAAGSDIVYACTFGANRVKLEEYGETDVVSVNRRLAQLAKQAVPGCLVAGDIAPTGQFIEPFGPTAFEDAVEIYKEQVRGLIEGGVDCFVIETMMDIQEARAALIAVRELSDAFCMVTMTYESSGRTLNGTDPLTALITLQSLGADAVGCNCSTGPAEMLEVIKACKPYAKVPLVAKPNAGLPQLKDGRTVFAMGPAEFAGFASAFAEAGVNLMGGCCGTTPEHIAALSQAIKGLKSEPPRLSAISAISSARRTLLMPAGGPTLVIGERINPTGKKQLQAELKEGKFSLVRQFAREQQEAGAEILDVNVGMPGIDEAATSNQVVGLLATLSDLPQCIDSSDIATIESSLRRYPGRALLNSISGEPGRLEKLAPIAAKYGAMFILLPIVEGGVPMTAAERSAIVKDLYDRLVPYGFDKSDIVVDGLAMAVSADATAARETLETLSWCRDFGLKTVLGLSNVSFGLPERRFINAGFMAMCVNAGLGLAIANPMSPELMALKLAADVLAGRDTNARRWLDFVATATITTNITSGGGNGGGQTNATASLSPAEKVRAAVIEGQKDDIQGLIDAALASGVSAQTLVDECMIPGIEKVGELYEAKTYYLPQLIASAETMSQGFVTLEPKLKEAGGATKAKGRILMATVQGDIHDIGKNIVNLMLKNNGFEVIDLGKDVKHEQLISAMKQHQPDIVGLSALMTTTMVGMQTAIDLARSEGINTPFMVGGAVVTPGFAESIGAHYSSDGVDAVKVAEQILASRAA